MASATIILRSKTAPSVTALYCCLRYKGKTVKIRTGESIKPNYWSFNTKRVLPSYPGDTSAFNERLEKRKLLAINQYDEFIKKFDRIPEPYEIKGIIENLILGLNDCKQSVPKDLFGYWEYFIEVQKKVVNPKTGKRLSLRTIQDYSSSLKKLKAFQKHYSQTINFESIDLDFYYSYIDYLESLDLSLNTVGKNIKILKTVLNDATSRNVNHNLQFKNSKFVVLSEEPTEVYLNMEELKELENLDLSSYKKLERARDLFLLLCWTGQRYQSLEHIVNTKVDEEVILLKQDKTNKKVVIPILPPTKRILSKYNKLDVYSNSKLNIYIKDVCKLMPSLNRVVETKKTKGGKVIQITRPKYELICTHSGRRSFATNFCNRKEFSIEEIMSITGHTSQRTFYTYVRTTPEERAKSFATKFNKIALTQEI